MTFPEKLSLVAIFVGLAALFGYWFALQIADHRGDDQDIIQRAQWAELEATRRALENARLANENLRLSAHVVRLQNYLRDERKAS